MVQVVHRDGKDAERYLGSCSLFKGRSQAGQRRLAIRDLRHLIQGNIPFEVRALHFGCTHQPLFEELRGADYDAKLVSERNGMHAYWNPLSFLVAQENVGFAGPAILHAPRQWTGCAA